MELVREGELFYIENLLCVMHRTRCFIRITFNLHKTWRSCYFPPYYESSKMLNNLSKLTELVPCKVTTQEVVFLTTKATHFTKPRLRVNIIFNNSSKELRTRPITSKHFFFTSVCITKSTLNGAQCIPCVCVCVCVCT